MIKKHRTTTKTLKSAKKSNRRKSPRIELRHKLSVRVRNEDISLTAANFGFGGIFLETENPLPIDAKMTIVLEHDGTKGETMARVVRQDDTGMAVAFVDPEDSFTKLLIMVVAPYLEE